MRKTFPVLWSLHGDTHTGKLEVTKERHRADARADTRSRFPAIPSSTSSSNAAPRRGSEGSPRSRCASSVSDVVRIASLAGAGSLHEISALLAADGRQDRVRQGLAGAGT